MNDKLLYFARYSLPSKYLRGKPLIYQSRSRSEEEVIHGGVVLETRGDVLIQVLWEIQTEAIGDVIFGDSDDDNYNKDPIKMSLAR